MSTHEAPQFGEPWDRYEPLRPAESDMPRLDLIVDEVMYRMTWRDTLVRTFDVGNGEYDHLLHRFSEDGSIYIFFNKVKAGDDIKKFLDENSFPHRRDPILDDEAVELFMRAEVKAMDREMNDLLNGQS